ncbi:nucleotide-diphospho-sugar transferase [Flavobacterium hungaricum]|uniref:Nucleotide-diphospho-sugar transferase n=1 Tax=Flavobacterium hungaricum TaxID=2082725 RepID=A0ABR9TF03_9FLAO|nr:nucleotide-diphospho-sugar transferase [Flavobacterium hungaricum]MBE8723932.1 nucleotide-diphospho-sugar transferase [Flavobacterium hungaricum]
MNNYKTKSPLLFLIFNRPDVTALVFEEIRKCRPSKLYVAADGPRTNKENEAELCNETRDIIKKIDWDCEVKTLFRDQNLGCKYAVSSAIDWFFENEEEGIILEDDCLPSSDFFVFADTMLEKYRYDTRIRHIGGTNLQMGQKRGNDSYYFSNLTHVWGWASWRRAWKDYDVELYKYRQENVQESFRNIFSNEIVVECWRKIFYELRDNKIDTWDYQWTITNFFNNSLSIIPNVNLISNIGFGVNATHTNDVNDLFSNLKTEKLLEITHPLVILPNKEADFFTLNREFKVKKRKRKNMWRKLKFWKKYNK